MAIEICLKTPQPSPDSTSAKFFLESPDKEAPTKQTESVRVLKEFTEDLMFQETSRLQLLDRKIGSSCSLKDLVSETPTEKSQTCQQAPVFSNQETEQTTADDPDPTLNEPANREDVDSSVVQTGKGPAAKRSKLKRNKNRPQVIS